jgi:taurine dioxygenase
MPLSNDAGPATLIFALRDDERSTKMANAAELEIVHVNAPLGHAVGGIDLSRPLDPVAVEGVERIFDTYGVIALRGQTITPEQHIAFSRHFGPLERYPIDTFLLPGHPEIFVVSNIVENGRPIGMADAGRVWHSDMHFTATPPRCSLLYAREVPIRDGRALGATLFASTAAAYDALPKDIKAVVDGRKALNSYGRYVARRSAKLNGGSTGQSERTKQATQHPDVWHPLVRTHPRTGRKCLYASDEVTCAVEGLSETEGEQLLKELLAHMTRPEFIYTHEWRVGDLLIWDNCSAIHNAIGDYGPDERRLMHRTTVAGGPTY